MKTKQIFLIACMLCACTVIFAQSDFSSTKIAAFKNGTGFFIKSGKVNATDGSYILKDPPEALFGTMWVAGRSERIKSLRSLQEKGVEKKEVKSIHNLLKGNINKNVKIIPFEGQSYEATILSVEEDIVSLKTKDKWVTTLVSGIKTLEFPAEPEKYFDQETENNQLSIEFNGPGSKDIDLMYLQKGIGWFPNYLIEIPEGKEAYITLRSTLINDVEDLENAEIDFVVGVPNFKYNYLSSPLSTNETLMQIIMNLSGTVSYDYGAAGLDNRYFSNAIMTQQAMPASGSIATDVSSGENAFTVADGGAQEDLYFYKHKNVNLKKGERMTCELLYAKVPFEHIYEADLPVNYPSYSYAYINQDSENTNKVWHSIKLNNNTKMPWTTGTAMVVKQDGKLSKPISQDMMKYTPVKSDTYLKITVSPDISVKDNDKEVKRQDKVKKRSGYYYDLVTVDASIKLKNFKDKDIKLIIKRSVYGELKDCNVNWKYSKVLNTYNYNNINPSNDIKWVVNLKAGEEKEIKYGYDIYVNN